MSLLLQIGQFNQLPEPAHRTEGGRRASCAKAGPRAIRAISRGAYSSLDATGPASTASTPCERSTPQPERSDCAIPAHLGAKPTDRGKVFLRHPNG